MICKHCKQEIPDESKFCPYCAVKLTEDLKTETEVRSQQGKPEYKETMSSETHQDPFAVPVSSNPEYYYKLTKKTNPEILKKRIGITLDILVVVTFLIFGIWLLVNYSIYVDTAWYLTKEPMRSVYEISSDFSLIFGVASLASGVLYALKSIFKYKFKK